MDFSTPILTPVNPFLFRTNINHDKISFFIGNLLAMPNGKLCYLDFGMVSFVEANQRFSIIEAVIHMVNRDYVALGHLYQRMGFVPDDLDLQPIILAFEQALPDVLNTPVSEFNFKNVIGKLGDIMYKFPFTLPPYYISIMKCLGVLEGLAMQVGKSIIGDSMLWILIFCSFSSVCIVFNIGG
jgi:aarF domain-containing kinase